MTRKLRIEIEIPDDVDEALECLDTAFEYLGLEAESLKDMAATGVNGLLSCDEDPYRAIVYNDQILHIDLSLLELSRIIDNAGFVGAIMMDVSAGEPSRHLGTIVAGESPYAIRSFVNEKQPDLFTLKNPDHAQHQAEPEPAAPESTDDCG